MRDREARVTETILRWSRVGKRAIAGVLMLLMFLLVASVTVQIVVTFFGVLLPGEPAVAKLVLSEAQMMQAFGLLLTVLIGLELIETVEVYFRLHAIHVEIVVLVAIIALARKVILLDLNKYQPVTLFALGFMVIALGGTYFLVRRAAPADTEEA